MTFQPPQRPAWADASTQPRTRIYNFTEEQRELLREVIQQFRDAARDDSSLARKLDDIAVALGYSLEP